ncbi:MAG: tetratricopeptide repeat protein [Saprospiraceae bacterium]|nr:tetratricopeptide repeat protein [Candidatus Vicinibacter affinis]MBP6173735.1 tetratricopeptide repeat protein [Saprospiraceae bacterium]MBK6572180.1 tetratricopeptide repeat protein [Candidatus Vicinibacter affinis]MBK7694005.1 tetratricopeptide repeat protein [Candidatus Vicinibacter affinis]MBK7799558.1 tetratricopeptide repeat protein [Candidatus Vicinibacter affinis]
MKNIFFLLFYFCFQITIIECKEKDVFHFNKPLNNKPKNTYAIVVGISNYQDPAIADLKDARRDAETFAAFLYSKSGGNLPQENVILLTDEQATLSRVANAINMLAQITTKNDGIILYFTGYGAEKLRPESLLDFFYFNDTPSDAVRAGSYPMMQHFAQLIKTKKNPYLIIHHLYSRQSNYNFENPIPLDKRKAIFKNEVFFNHKATDPNVDLSELNSAKINLNHHLMDALLGLADQNKNMQVSFKEIGDYFSQLKVPKETGSGLLYLACSKLNYHISEVDMALMKNIQNQDFPSFPSILKSESTEKEQRIISGLNQNIKDLYQNFLITIKLGHLMPPDEPSASMLLDSLASHEEIKSLNSDFKRKLSAALQDETQQAINAYLNADSKELLRRSNFKDKYRKYPAYLDKSIQLSGPQNFMYKILEAKKYYFLGLNKRFEAIDQKDESLFSEALDMEFKGLEFEPEASFIHNEIANIYASTNQPELAKKYLLQAIELTPSWSIPYSNLSKLSTNSPLESIKYGKIATRLNETNVFAWNSLGTAYLRNNNFEDAEGCFVRAIKLEPKYSEAYYNLACIRSIQNEIPAAIKLLENACRLGFNEPDYIYQDADFNNLRKSLEFEQLMSKYFPNHLNKK